MFLLCFPHGYRGLICHYMTTPRKTVSPLKEKKVASPSLIPTKPKTSSATTSRKQVPNYLKPTASSLGVFDHPPTKKPVITSNKPDLNRRRSFDKPPSSSLIHKSAHTTLRTPSPILSKTKSSPKPLLKKIIQSSSSAKANTGMQKTNSTVLSTNEKETKIEVGNSKKEDEPLLVNDIEEEVKVVETNENKLASSEIPIVDDPSTSKDSKTCDLDDENKLAVDVGIKGVGEKVLVEEVVDNNHDAKEGENDNVEKGVTEDGEDEAKEEGKGEQEEKVDDGSENDVKNDDALKVGEVSEIVSKEEDSGKVGEDEEGKDGKGKEVAITIGNARGETAKKEYNDVIEETKTKLLEKRKNKVLALVGAFETVMSLEEPQP